jgi:hypothetical protein
MFPDKTMITVRKNIPIGGKWNPAILHTITTIERMITYKIRN